MHLCPVLSSMRYLFSREEQNLRCLKKEKAQPPWQQAWHLSQTATCSASCSPIGVSTVGLLGGGWVQREGLHSGEGCLCRRCSTMDCLGNEEGVEGQFLGFCLSSLPWPIWLHVVNEEFKWGPFKANLENVRVVLLPGAAVQSLSGSQTAREPNILG